MRHLTFTLCVLSLLSVCLFPASGQAQSDSDPKKPKLEPLPEFSVKIPATARGKIGRIVVKGNRHFNEFAILSMSGYNVGAPYSQDTLDAMRTKLFGTGYFGYATSASAVQVSGETTNGENVVTIAVEENAPVKSVVVKGNGPIAADKIGALVTRTPVYNPVVFEKDTKSIEALYQKEGYGATVVPENVFDPDTGRLTIPLSVLRIGSLRVEGNRHYPSDLILRTLGVKKGDYYHRKTLEEKGERVYRLDLIRAVEYASASDLTSPLSSSELVLVLRVTEFAPSFALPKKEAPRRKSKIRSVTRPDSRDSVTVPLVFEKQTHHSSPYIRLRVNGVPLLFVLDTGAPPPIVLTPGTARLLKLETRKPDGETDEAIREAELKSIALAGAVRNGVRGDIAVPIRSATVMENTEMIGVRDVGERVAGIVGMRFLMHLYHAARFDFARRELTLYPRPSPPLRPVGAAVLPLTDLSLRCTVPVAAPNGPAVPLMVDTGMSGYGLSLLPGVVSAFRPARTPQVFSVKGTLYGIGRERKHLLPALRLGTFREAGVSATEAKRDSLSNILGMGVLRRFRVTLDFFNGEMVLERASDYHQQARLPGDDFVEYDSRGDEYYVADLPAQSTAYRAGVRVGDVLLAVNGRPLSRIEGDPLFGYAGDPVRLTLRRGTKRVQVRYALQNEFSFPTPPLVHFGLKRESQDGRLLVSIVLPGSPAAEAGVKIGDEIVASDDFSGERLRRKARLKLNTRLREGETVRLKLKRDGNPDPIEVTLKARKLN